MRNGRILDNVLERLTVNKTQNFPVTGGGISENEASNRGNGSKSGIIVG